MATTLHLTGSFDPPITVPLGVQSFEAFRAWTLSDDFPEKGRIDYIKGRIDFDMSPEKLISHGKLKVAFIRAVGDRVDGDDLGHLVADQSRVVHAGAELSVEPELLILAPAMNLSHR